MTTPNDPRGCGGVRGGSSPPAGFPNGYGMGTEGYGMGTAWVRHGYGRFLTKTGPPWLRLIFFQAVSGAFFKAQLWSRKKSGSIFESKVDILARGRFGS